MLFVGVDLGTTSVKLLLMDEFADIKKIVSREYPIYYPQTGWSEQNPEDWFDRLMLAFAELLQGQAKEQVEGISFSGQMHGMVILDEKDRVIRPAILWNDGRTQAECDYLNNEIGQEKISSYTGNMALTGFTAPKLLWVKKHEPDNFRKIKKVMLPKDYLAFRMSGVYSTDVSDASGTLLFDVKNKQWSQEMLKIVGLEAEQMPEVFESYQVTGSLQDSIAKELGLSPDVKIVAGGGDQAVAAVGTGTVGHGMCNVSLGTSGVVFVASRKYSEIDDNALHVFAHADGKYHFMGVTLAAAASNEWWMKNILESADYDKEQAEFFKLGENDVYFLPYLMGERTPYNNPAARAAFIGMDMETSRADMTGAVLEGVAFSLRDSLEIVRKNGVEINSIRINGGGAKSRLWCEIIANVLNVEVNKIHSEEGPAFGAAILAAVGCEKYKTVEQACAKLIKLSSTVKPNQLLLEKYNKKYEIYHGLYPVLEESFEKMAGN
jgi:xylulokinase